MLADVVAHRQSSPPVVLQAMTQFEHRPFSRHVHARVTSLLLCMVYVPHQRSLLFAKTVTDVFFLLCLFIAIAIRATKPPTPPPRDLVRNE